MSHARVRVIAALIVLGTGVTLSADQVKLRSGKVIDGMFIGADSRSVRLLREDGTVTEVALSDAVSMTFDPRKATPPLAPPPARKPPAAAPAAAAPAAAAPAAAAPAAAPAPPARRTFSVPAGTAFNVRLTQAIDVDASKAGQTFKGVVDDPVMVGGAIAIPRGATAVIQAVNVEQSGKMKGSDKITLKVNAIGFGGMMYDVTTAYVESKGKGEGKKTARKIGGGAGLGAIVGGIAGGGEGAAIGAAIGGVTGAAMAGSGEEHLKLPAETRLQFTFSAAVRVSA